MFSQNLLFWRLHAQIVMNLFDCECSDFKYQVRLKSKNSNSLQLLGLTELWLHNGICFHIGAETHKCKQGGHWVKKWAEGLQYIFEESYLVIGQ